MTTKADYEPARDSFNDWHWVPCENYKPSAKHEGIVGKIHWGVFDFYRCDCGHRFPASEAYWMTFYTGQNASGIDLFCPECESQEVVYDNLARRRELDAC